MPLSGPRSSGAAIACPSRPRRDAATLNTRWRAPTAGDGCGDVSRRGAGRRAAVRFRRDARLQRGTGV